MDLEGFFCCDLALAFVVTDVLVSSSNGGTGVEMPSVEGCDMVR